jgi:hypothetical protein
MCLWRLDGYDPSLTLVVEGSDDMTSSVLLHTLSVMVWDDLEH